jgi:hypothetical protein
VPRPPLQNKREAVMPRLRNGHAPGHVRETFCNAI